MLVEAFSSLEYLNRKLKVINELGNIEIHFSNFIRFISKYLVIVRENLQILVCLVTRKIPIVISIQSHKKRYFTLSVWNMEYERTGSSKVRVTTNSTICLVSNCTARDDIAFRDKGLAIIQKLIKHTIILFHNLLERRTLGDFFSSVFESSILGCPRDKLVASVIRGRMQRPVVHEFTLPPMLCNVGASIT